MELTLIVPFGRGHAGIYILEYLPQSHGLILEHKVIAVH